LKKEIEMAKHYEFVAYDDEDKKEVKISFTTESDTWTGYDGPMYEFFNFLKGAGFVFDINTQIGVMDKDGEFTSAIEEW
jgi:hypothetical protein